MAGASKVEICCCNSYNQNSFMLEKEGQAPNICKSSILEQPLLERKAFNHQNNDCVRHLDFSSSSSRFNVSTLSSKTAFSC